MKNQKKKELRGLYTSSYAVTTCVPVPMYYLSAKKLILIIFLFDSKIWLKTNGVPVNDGIINLVVKMDIFWGEILLRA